MKSLSLLWVLISTSCWVAGGIRLETFQYPYPVKWFTFTSQRQDVEMAYMDIRPEDKELKTVVLLHGKNFSGAYWGQTAEALSRAGYRVIIPDQIGFGKSSKPLHYQYSFEQLSANTRELLNHLDIKTHALAGHSMGGMLATRYALMYPETSRVLLLINPIGLEDWQAKGVPYVTPDQSFQQELNQTPEKLRAYQQENYYGGQWKPEYQIWVEMLAQFLSSPDYPRMAWNQALTTDMIFTQPVYYEFGRLKMPVLLMICQDDRTAIGKDRVSADQRKLLGNYPELGRQTASAIPNAKLVELPGVGHLPHIESFPQFISPVIEFLNTHPLTGKRSGESNSSSLFDPIPERKTDTWNGFTRHTFSMHGCTAWVVEPKQSLPGNPWSWCMEFPDAFVERCASLALLKRGFYHAHISVGNTFGCPAAIKHFNALYDLVTGLGLARKVALIGISRGGLYAYRWASENPKRVAVIYGDAPVCDFKSWPGGKGRGVGSPGDWTSLLSHYGFQDEAQALAYRGNPIDMLAPLAAAGVALIHVVGDVDEVVPVAENTSIMEERYQQLGGTIRVIHKPAVGHHPHGLADPSPVVDFISKYAVPAGAP